MRGLSPPTRGSPARKPSSASKLGSIPAHTGKPRSSVPSPMTKRVYPRPHGEADTPSRRASARRGLSPPTRGSLRGGGLDLHAIRSIPAHTGKPPTACSRARTRRVYPRPHGEATASTMNLPSLMGLSPPTRGSRGGLQGRKAQPGSIPAHTGKPGSGMELVRPASVYPRPHGEAGSIRWQTSASRGLSPPTRGSLGKVVVHVAVEGSIPAHTGKPMWAIATV